MQNAVNSVQEEVEVEDQGELLRRRTNPLGAIGLTKLKACFCPLNDVFKCKPCPSSVYPVVVHAVSLQQA